MNEPGDVERLLEILGEEPKPELSPFFEARLARAVQQEHRGPDHGRLIRWGALAMLVFSAIILWQYPYLRWLIPLAVILCLPEDWGDAIVRRRPASRVREP